ncbi:MAG: glutamate--tRNA ligase family protein, partial [Clostridia bacterium]
KFDESIVCGGAYGPYRQSERKEIYHVYAKKMVSEGKAYPCFCTAEQLTEMRNEQMNIKQTPGYYGKYAKCRDLTYEQIEQNIKSGIPYVLRLKSFGSEENKIKTTDLIKGTIEISENFIDHIILKSNGMPDYHFAHAVDDHLMRTTHVVRGEEWLPSLPYHIQLFNALGFKLPKYLHLAQLMRLDGTAKKKLSKRDKGAGLSSYISDGYAPECVVEYILTLLNSNFEDWRRANPTLDINDFPFSIKKMSASGSLFDLEKLSDVSKNVISRMTTEQVFQKLTKWAESYDEPFAALLKRDTEYTKKILSIGRGGAKSRKDFALWSEVKPLISFFFDELFKITDQINGFDKSDIKTASDLFCDSYNAQDDQNVWFEKVKTIAEKIGFCPNMKEYKENPDKYKGNVGDVSSFIRIAVTGRQNSPDLYTVMQIIGSEKIKDRIRAYKESL